MVSLMLETGHSGIALDLIGGNVKASSLARRLNIVEIPFQIDQGLRMGSFLCGSN